MFVPEISIVAEAFAASPIWAAVPIPFVITTSQRRSVAFFPVTTNETASPKFVPAITYVSLVFVSVTTPSSFRQPFPANSATSWPLTVIPVGWYSSATVKPSETAAAIDRPFAVKVYPPPGR